MGLNSPPGNPLPIPWRTIHEIGVQNGVSFSRVRAEFTRQNGQLAIREGVLKGPMIGGTIEGSIDSSNQLRMSGTFVPMYGLNNMFGQIPVLGLFLGNGNNEGLIGVTYEVVGTPSAPVLRVNPISAIFPGVTRKILSQTDGPAPGYVTLLVEAEIEAGVNVGRHTHPGIESAYVLEGGFELPIEGQPTRTLKPGDGFQIPPAPRPRHSVHSRRVRGGGSRSGPARIAI